MKVRFENHFRRVSQVSLACPSVEEFSDETMLFSASWGFAREFGGPLTQSILDSLERYSAPPEGLWSVIDTRVHMLMPGMYPAIPGWHGDAFPRQDGASQPSLEDYNPRVRHWTCCLSSRPAGTSSTLFLAEPVSIDVDLNRVWGSVDDDLRNREAETYEQKDGELIEFYQDTLHTAQPARNRGWRLFFRMSWYHRRPHNRIRRQVQVYTTLGKGW